MRSSIAKLVSYTYEKDSYGVLRRNSTSRKVFVDVVSVSASEFFDGGRNGLKPALRFTMFRYDYQNEDVIEYEGVQYSIYRTYFKNYDQIDLYTELKKGNEKEN